MAEFKTKFAREPSESMKKFMDTMKRLNDIAAKFLEQRSQFYSAQQLRTQDTHNQLVASFNRLKVGFRRLENILERSVGMMTAALGSLANRIISGFSIESFLVSPALSVAGTLTIGLVPAIAAAFRWMWSKVTALAESMLTDRRFALGTGATVGGIRAFRSTLGTVIPGAEELLTTIGRIRLDQASNMAMIVRWMLGVKKFSDTSQAVSQTLITLQRWLKAQRKRDVLAISRMRGIEVSPEIQNMLVQMSEIELLRTVAEFERQRQKLMAPDEAQLKLAQFILDIRQIWNNIENTLGKALAESGIVDALIRVSKAFGVLIDNMLKLPVTEEWIKSVEEKVKWFGDWLGDTNNQKKIASVVEGIITSLEKGIVELGRLSFPQVSPEPQKLQFGRVGADLNLRINKENWERMLRESPRSTHIEDRRPGFGAAAPPQLIPTAPSAGVTEAPSAPTREPPTRGPPSREPTAPTTTPREPTERPIAPATPYAPTPTRPTPYAPPPTPTEPSTRVTPTQPYRPVTPTRPYAPITPTAPAPVTPTQPYRPVEPTTPYRPTERPTTRVSPTQPSQVLEATPRHTRPPEIRPSNRPLQPIRPTTPYPEAKPTAPQRPFRAPVPEVPPSQLPRTEVPEAPVSPQVVRPPRTRFPQEIRPPTAPRLPQPEPPQPRPGGLYDPITARSIGGGVGGTSASMGRGRHQGVDLMAPKGSSVYAVKDGVIDHFGRDNFGQPTVTIRHNDGTYSRYLHMNQRFGNVGDPVKGGQQIGTSGTANGAEHLHYEYWRGDPRGRNKQLLDPMREFGWDRKTNLPQGGQLTRAAPPGQTQAPSPSPTSKPPTTRASPGGGDNWDTYLRGLTHLETDRRDLRGGRNKGYFQQDETNVREAKNAGLPNAQYINSGTYAQQSQATKEYIKRFFPKAAEAIDRGDWKTANNELKGHWVSLPGGDPRQQQSAAKYKGFWNILNSGGQQTKGEPRLGQFEDPSKAKPGVVPPATPTGDPARARGAQPWMPSDMVPEPPRGGGARQAPAAVPRTGPGEWSDLPKHPEANAYNMTGVDPRLREVLSAARDQFEKLHPGYKVTGWSGRRAVGAGAGPHWSKSGAIDTMIVDDKGNMVSNEGSDPTGLYHEYAQIAKGEQMARYPELNRKFAWGGAFGTKKGGGGPPDLMHFDLSGERGHWTQNWMSNMGVYPGLVYGKPVPQQSPPPAQTPWDGPHNPVPFLGQQGYDQAIPTQENLNPLDTLQVDNRSDDHWTWVNKPSVRQVPPARKPMGHVQDPDKPKPTQDPDKPAAPRQDPDKASAFSDDPTGGGQIESPA